MSSSAKRDGFRSFEACPPWLRWAIEQAVPLLASNMPDDRANRDPRWRCLADAWNAAHLHVFGSRPSDADGHEFMRVVVEPIVEERSGRVEWRAELVDRVNRVLAGEEEVEFRVSLPVAGIPARSEKLHRLADSIEALMAMALTDGSTDPVAISGATAAALLDLNDPEGLGAARGSQLLKTLDRVGVIRKVEQGGRGSANRYQPGDRDLEDILLEAPSLGSRIADEAAAFLAEETTE